MASTTRLTHRLALLPSLLGAGAVVVLVVGAALAGIGDRTEWASSVVVVAAVGVGLTVVTGHPVGLYIGMALFVIAGLGGSPPLRGRDLVIATLTMLAVHEISRPSLDARRPARFGPSVWWRYTARSLVIAAVLAVAVVAWARFDSTTLPTWLVPVGIAIAALPMFVRGTVDQNRFGLGGRPQTWWGLAVLSLGASVLLAVSLTVVVGAANARSEIETTPTAPAVEEGPAPPTSEFDPPSAIERGVSFLLVIAAFLIAWLLYAALKRPEVPFDLDEAEVDLDESALTIAGPGQADLEEGAVEIDERELADLLDTLALDLSSEPDPGRAIRYAYATIERRLAGLGLERADSETEQEYLLRALPQVGHERAAMVELTGLFERARFGVDPVSEVMRGRALDAVDRLRATTITASSGASATTNGIEGR